MAALSIVFLILAAVVPTMRLSLIALSGIAAALLTAEFGPGTGLMCFVAVGILSMLFIPASGWVYVVFFGWYSVLKCVIERLKSRRLSWILKFLAFNAAFMVLWFLLPAVLTELLPKFSAHFWLLLLAGNAAFLLYDIALSGLLDYYIGVLLPKIRKKRGD